MVVGKPAIIGLSINGSHQFAAAATVAELAQVNALPGTEIEFSLGDRHADRGSDHCRLDVCRHIIRAFDGMGKERHILWNEVVENAFKIRQDRWIGILLNAQGGGGVLDKKVEKAGGR